MHPNQRAVLGVMLNKAAERMAGQVIEVSATPSEDHAIVCRAAFDDDTRLIATVARGDDRTDVRFYQTETAGSMLYLRLQDGALHVSFGTAEDAEFPREQHPLVARTMTDFIARLRERTLAADGADFTLEAPEHAGPTP